MTYFWCDFDPAHAYKPPKAGLCILYLWHAVFRGGLVEEGWSGDLRRLSLRAWREDSDLAAMVVVRGGDAAGWMNLKHVPPRRSRFVWLWIRHAAYARPPGDILWASDLATMLPPDPQAKEA